MSLKNYILQVLKIIQSHVLTQTFKTFSFFSAFITSNLTYPDLVVFLLLAIPFPLFWMTLFDIKSFKTSFSKTAGSIRQRSWNVLVKSFLLFQVEKLKFLVFFKGIRALTLYNSSGPNCIRFFDTWRKY